MDEDTPTPGRPLPLSPLADPVIGAIFCDAAHAGDAAASIATAVLTKDGRSLGRVLSVTPQSYHKDAGGRGVRIDVEALTDRNEHTTLEFQAAHDPSLFQRNLFSAARIFTATTPEGSRPRLLATVIHKVIAINFLNFNVRDGAPGTPAREYLQPVKLLYTKPPHVAALEEFSIYNIQLRRFREAPVDFSDPLYCWTYLWDTADREKKTIEEVLAMSPELQAFARRDAGFTQYCERYDRVAADPEVQDAYYRWLDENTRQAAMAQWQWNEGMREGERKGKLEGKRKGKLEGKLELARNLLTLGVAPEQIAQAAGLPLADVKALR